MNMQHSASATWIFAHLADPEGKVGASSWSSLHVIPVPVMIKSELMAYPPQKVHFVDEKEATGADVDGAFVAP